MTMSIIGVEVRGTSCRFAEVRPHPSGEHEVGEIHRCEPTSIPELASAVRTVFPDLGSVGVSVPGVVDADGGRVSHCLPAPWANGPFGQGLAEELPGVEPAVVSHGEAHLRAHHPLIAAHPALSVAVDTGIGIGVTNDAGYVTRPRHDSSWHIGPVAMSAADANGKSWATLGGSDLDELVNPAMLQGDPQELGRRLAEVLARLAVVFQPRTIVVCGGFVEEDGDIVVATATAELDSRVPDWALVPRVVPSRFGEHGALVGAATLFGDGATRVRSRFRRRQLERELEAGVASPVELARSNAVGEVAIAAVEEEDPDRATNTELTPAPFQDGNDASREDVEPSGEAVEWVSSPWTQPGAPEYHLGEDRDEQPGPPEDEAEPGHEPDDGREWVKAPWVR